MLPVQCEQTSCPCWNWWQHLAKKCSTNDCNMCSATLCSGPHPHPPTAMSRLQVERPAAAPADYYTDLHTPCLKDLPGRHLAAKCFEELTADFGDSRCVLDVFLIVHSVDHFALHPQK